MSNWKKETRVVEIYTGSMGDPTCAECHNLETGRNVALVCIAGEWIGRRWSSWEQIDDRKVWMRKEKDGDREVTIDLVEDFFTKLNL